MNLTKHTLNYILKNEFHHVYSTVLDLKKFGEIHPFMTQVDHVRTADDHTEFFIKEKVLIFGFIPLRPSYYARVYEVEKGRHIRYTSKIMGLIDLSINFTFSQRADSGEIHLEEVIQLKGIRFLTNISLGVMKESHKMIFSLLQAPSV